MYFVSERKKKELHDNTETEIDELTEAVGLMVKT